MKASGLSSAFGGHHNGSFSTMPAAGRYVPLPYGKFQARSAALSPLTYKAGSTFPCVPFVMVAPAPFRVFINASFSPFLAPRLFFPFQRRPTLLLSSPERLNEVGFPRKISGEHSFFLQHLALPVPPLSDRAPIGSSAEFCSSLSPAVTLRLFLFVVG